MDKNRIPKKVLYMNLGTRRLRGRSRNRWQDEVREDGRIVDGEGWQEKVCNRQEWKMLLRTARNRRILHMPMEWMNSGVTASCLLGCYTVLLCKQLSVFERILVPTTSGSSTPRKSRPPTAWLWLWRYPTILQKVRTIYQHSKTSLMTPFIKLSFVI